MRYQKQLEEICVTVTNAPVTLYESVELLSTCVNNKKLAALTREGAYCLTQEELEPLAEQICADVDFSDPWMQFFFRSYPAQDDFKNAPCLASCIAYIYFNVMLTDSALQQQLSYTADHWKRTRRSGYRVGALNRFTLDFERTESAGPIRLYEELKRLPISAEFVSVLYEAFSDLDFYTERLLQLISPVASRLEAALQAYEARTDQLARQWAAFFESRDCLNAFLRKWTGTEIAGNIRELRIALRYLDAHTIVGNYLPEEQAVVMHVGVDILPALAPPKKEPNSNLDREFAAFKLLGDKGRRDILRLLNREPLSMQDIVNQLGLNSGTVFRNVNMLFHAGLLSRETRGERLFYQAKLHEVQELFDHMMAYLRGEAGDDNP